MGKRAPVFFLILFLLCIYPYYLAPESYNELGAPFITNYAPKEYKSSAQNWGIIQDQRGVMYFANNNGILEFDGLHWRSEIKPPNNSNIRSLDVDERGVIYVGAVGEIGFLEPDALGQQQYVSLLNKIPDNDRDFGDVWRLYATGHGVYFFTKNRILRYFNGRITVKSIVQNMPINSNKINDCLYYICDEGIAMIKDGNHHILPYTQRFLNSNNYIQILPYPENKLMVCDQKWGFFLYDTASLDIQSDGQIGIKKETGETDVLQPFATEIVSYLAVNPNYCGIALNNGFYAFGTLSGGLVLMDFGGRLVQIINEHRGLPNQNIWYLYQDGAGNLWVALNGMLSYVEIASPITQFKELSGQDDPVLSVARYRKRLYVGDFKGLHCLQPYTVNIHDDKQEFKTIIPKSEIWSLLEVKDILLVAANWGFSTVNDNGVFQRLKVKGVYCMGQSRKFPDYVITGHWNPGGLSVLKLNWDSKKHNWQIDLFDVNELASLKDNMVQIDDDAEGNLWLTTAFNGIMYIRFSDANFNHFKTWRYTQSHGLPQDAWNHLFIKENYLYVATKKGIFISTISIGAHFNPDTLRFIPEQTFGNWFNQTKQPVSMIRWDHHGDIWLDGDNRFYKLKLKKDGSYASEILPLYKTNSNEFTHLLIEPDGIAWICSDTGLYRMDTLKKKTKNPDFSVLIRQVKSNRQTLFYGSNYREDGIKKRILDSIQPDKLKSTLPYIENNLTFTCAAPVYESGLDIQYGFFLEGMNRDWSQWQYDTKKEYTNIPEGKYIFKVKARDISGRISQAATYEFRILPPWHRTFVAIIIYVLGFILLVYAGIRFNTRRLLVAKKKLEDIVKARTMEIVKQKDEINEKNKRLQDAYEDLSVSNQQLTETKNALWGEMQLAKKIQTVLLPKDPKIPGLEISVYMNPADEVGGDYYDVIEVKGEWSVDGPSHWLTIGDVSGHGVPAGLIMMMVQTAIHAVLTSHASSSPAVILQKTNQVIRENIKKLGEDKYMTITLFYYKGDGRFYFSGLHQDIMIYRSQTKHVEIIETQGVWLGIMDNIEDLNQVMEFTLNSGDTMLLYTDGITEAQDKTGRLYSDEKLLSFLTDYGDRSPQHIKELLLKSLNEYSCPDDITFMVIERI